MINYIVRILIFAGCSVFLMGSDHRRIGRLENTEWEEYFALGANEFPYEINSDYPDLSIVGALVSSSNAVGTATLIAPNVIVTAAHVIKDSYADNLNPSDWAFYMGADLSHPASGSGWDATAKYPIKEFFIHDGWTIRQAAGIRSGDGDGDELGVDLALGVLYESVEGYFPGRLPESDDDPLGAVAILSGYGTLIHGRDGTQDESNRKRTGARNTIDRSVAKVSKPGVPEIALGGILGIDFDSPSGTSNTLGSNNNIELLGNGESNSIALDLEASTAPGDSGGPAFVHTKQAWRIHGVVSYGAGGYDDSRYGDVTIYTRLASHYDWIHSQLPNWHNAKLIGEGDWRESPWLGPFLPYASNWHFFTELGWMYAPIAVGDSLWAWNYLVQDWLWFGFNYFPYVYAHFSNTWLYISEENSNALSIRGFDFSQGKWRTFKGTR